MMNILIPYEKCPVCKKYHTSWEAAIGCQRDYVDKLNKECEKQINKKNALKEASK